MKKYVVVATKGRPLETRVLLDMLAAQDARPDVVHIVGASVGDLPDVAGHPLLALARVEMRLAKAPGLTIQRNAAIEAILKDAPDEAGGERWFACFFDDDFRPHPGWLRHCEALFEGQSDVIGMTGQVLADGVKSGGVSEADALRYLSGEKPRELHWASGSDRRDAGCAYGCNMAFVDRVFRAHRFDEALPLYGWQEDYDFTARARELGAVVYEPSCLGVHLGVRSGRTSGVKFGYSQVANPLYLARKHTMQRYHACRYIARHLLSNLYHSLRGHPLFDYRGRLKGNLLALADIVRGVNHPLRILDL